MKFQDSSFTLHKLQKALKIQICTINENCKVPVKFDGI